MSDARIGWYVASADASTASIRLRCLVPMAELHRRGRQVELWHRNARGQGCDALIFSKVYDDRAYEVAREVKSRGTRVLLDLCDNHWFGEDDHPAVQARAQRLERMLGSVDLVTASTATLAGQIRARFGISEGRIAVVPDPVIEPELPPLSFRGRMELMLLRHHLRLHRSAYHLIWFGNHGAGHVQSGMGDLDRVRSVIESDGLLTLTIVSNSAKKFRKLFRDWRVPTRYVPWRLDTVDRVLAMHDCAVIPITSNPFTEAKTMNRPATALMAGLDVFADRIPSYDELAPFITLDAWHRLHERTVSRELVHDRIRAAQAYLGEYYSPSRVAIHWAEAVEQALA